jgi:hypothetical protein
MANPRGPRPPSGAYVAWRAPAVLSLTGGHGMRSFHADESQARQTQVQRLAMLISGKAGPVELSPLILALWKLPEVKTSTGSSSDFDINRRGRADEDVVGSGAGDARIPVHGVNSRPGTSTESCGRPRPVGRAGRGATCARGLRCGCRWQFSHVPVGLPCPPRSGECSVPGCKTNRISRCAPLFLGCLAMALISKLPQSKAG